MNKNTITFIMPHLIIGDKQQFKNMVLFPIYSDDEEQCKYITLSEALLQNKLEITEVSSNGSVPNLKVINNSKDKVLLTDSEEVIGAKQNRIINTSILLKPNSVSIIPVSCTESGRWSYKSQNFSDSETMAFTNIRLKKAASVSNNLFSKRGFASDQGEVWNEIGKYSLNSKTYSPTDAMKDTFESKKHEIEDYLKAFQVSQSQKGFIIMINGIIVGIDYFSRSEAFSKINDKLLRSYALEAYLGQGERITDFTYTNPEVLLNNIAISDTKHYKSPGHGWDVRISASHIIGHALVYKNEVIHLAAFYKNSKFGK